MAHEVESVLYRGQVPWHGLGTEILEGWTPDDILRNAKLDWTVSKRQITYQRAMGRGNLGLAFAKNHYVLARDTDDRFYGTCTKEYTPIQNINALRHIMELAQEGSVKIETIGSLRDGAIVWALARLGDLYLENKEKIEEYFLIVVRHQPGHSVIYKYTNVRVVCANTVALAISEDASEEVRIQHSAKFETALSHARMLFASAKQISEKFQLQANKLISAEFDQVAAFDLIKKIIQPALPFGAENLSLPLPLSYINETQPEQISPTFRSIVESYFHAPGATPGTKWGLFNAVTDHYDHRSKVRSQENRAASGWFGDSNATKQKFMKELLAA
jgi:phage/plasmid-like protein (TIGR03299 family)